MGCDIHLKTYVFSKDENRMVPATSILEDGNARYLPLIVDDRDYDLFGLFGNSVRSNYAELDCFELGPCPDFVKGTAIEKQQNYDHTQRWCWCDKLKTSLLDYKECLLDPNKYKERFGVFRNPWALEEDNDISLEDFQEYHRCLVSSIDYTLKKIDELISFLSDFDEYVDTGKIAFVTWMDS